METKTGRFRRTHRLVHTRRGLRGEVLALRHELELLDEALGRGPEPDSARLALDYAFTHLRAAERAWQELRRPAELHLVVTQIDASRDALEASVAARAGRPRTRARASECAGSAVCRPAPRATSSAVRSTDSPSC